MRKVVYGGACSLDGFLAGRGGELDWLHFSKDVQREMARTWASSDTVLFGRKTWEGAVVRGAGSGGSIPGLKSYVFSRTLASIDAPGVDLVNDDAGAFVRALKSQPGKDMVVMSGGNLARSLIDAGVVDEIGLNVHPILLGGGVPAFLESMYRVPLELVECRTLDGGCVLLTYRVRYAAAT
jgi:dihydrofolate reductase